MPELDINPIDEDAVLREVWNITDVEAKTELSAEQIEKVNKLKTMAQIFGNHLLSTHLTTFMTLQKSKDRKSMQEFVDVVRAKREDFVNKGKSWFNSLTG